MTLCIFNDDTNNFGYIDENIIFLFLFSALQEMLQSAERVDANRNLSLYCFVEGNSKLSNKWEQMPFYQNNFQNLNQILEKVPAVDPKCDEPLGFSDVALYIYTSGTTGE
jgi:long-subunit acyl-CoA synthetase (AMP-forming)